MRVVSLHKHTDLVEPVEKIKVDVDQVTQHLSHAIQCKTISIPDLTGKDCQAWINLHEVLKKDYPVMHEKLLRKIINGYSLLYTWLGSDKSLQPIMFLAHQDVVPVDIDTEKEWTHPPFEGACADGYVWGRGALDMKGQLVTLLEAVESLLKMGYSPKRTIYLAFGHDEEIYGMNGALQIAKALHQQGVRLAALLDEGGNLIENLLPGIQFPMALVGLGEKGFLTLNLNALGKPGHSSAPARQTAIGIIARAIALIDDNPFPARLEVIKPALQKAGSALPFSWQIMIANAWLFGRLLMRQLEKSAQLNAQIRTTAAATMISGGVKDNILPAQAQAKINFRLMSGDSVEKVLRNVKKVVADPRVSFEIDGQRGWEASQVSPTHTPAYFTLELTIRQIFNNVPVATTIFRGATDARHFQSICKHIYRFSPHIISAEDAARIHGVNERISLKDLGSMVNFYARLTRIWGDAEF